MTDSMLVKLGGQMTALHDIQVKLGSIDGKLTVLITLNIAMVLAAIGPYLTKLFA